MSLPFPPLSSVQAITAKSMCLSFKLQKIACFFILFGLFPCIILFILSFWSSQAADYYTFFQHQELSTCLMITLPFTACSVIGHRLFVDAKQNGNRLNPRDIAHQWSLYGIIVMNVAATISLIKLTTYFDRFMAYVPTNAILSILAFAILAVGPVAPVKDVEAPALIYPSC